VGWVGEGEGGEEQLYDALMRELRRAVGVWEAGASEGWKGRRTKVVGCAMWACAFCRYHLCALVLYTLHIDRYRVPWRAKAARVAPSKHNARLELSPSPSRITARSACTSPDLEREDLKTGAENREIGTSTE